MDLAVDIFSMNGMFALQHFIQIHLTQIDLNKNCLNKTLVGNEETYEAGAFCADT